VFVTKTEADAVALPMIWLTEYRSATRSAQHTGKLEGQNGQTTAAAEER
jgi:hypothetical protein